MNNVNPFSEFTVVVPIFNKKDYIKRCLFSISKASNGEYLEVILVDDGSTDNWEEVLKENSFLNLEIKVIKQSNQGVSSARNTGLKNCSTKYCCFLDADDEWTGQGPAELQAVRLRRRSGSLCTDLRSQ